MGRRSGGSFGRAWRTKPPSGHPAWRPAAVFRSFYMGRVLSNGSKAVYFWGWEWRF